MMKINLFFIKRIHFVLIEFLQPRDLTLGSFVRIINVAKLL